MRLKRSMAVAAILVLFAGTFIWYVIRVQATRQFMAHFQPPPVTVSSTKVFRRDWQPTLQAVGSFRAVNSVNVTSQVPGMVVAIYFRSGQQVEEGQSLVRLDDSLDLQTLNNSMAQLKLDRVNFERQQKLYKNRAASKSELDTAQAKYDRSEADVASAKVNVDRKDIKAPFSGKVGIRQVDLGQYVQAGTPLVPLQSQNPLFVDFSLPEQDMKKLQIGQAVSIKIEAHPDKEFLGKITAINSLVDSNTRNILVQATVPNDDGALYPGVFAWVSVLLPQRKEVLTVPQTAVSYSMYGDTAYVIQSNGDSKDKSQKVEQRFIKVGKKEGNYVEVLSGLKEGEQVVTSGQIKLFPGSRVLINNTVNPI